MAGLSSTRQRIQHLLRRAGFGYSAAELAEYAALGLEGAVDRLLHPQWVDDAATEAAVEPFEAIFAEPGDPRDPEVQRRQREVLWRAWYLRLTLSRRPLQERMTYVWHDHFATGQGKVNNPYLMYRQNAMFRAGALGSFRELLLGVARDPAMMVYLDNRSNTRQAPNENFARELFELHTLGEGNGYTERDIKEAARALTGWRIDEEYHSVFRRNLFDPGQKTILGKTAVFTDESLIAMLCDDPRVAAYLADHLVRVFVHPDGDAALTKRAAARFTATGGSIREVMRTILTSDEFYAPRAYRAIVKSPTELIVGAKRALELVPDGRTELDISTRLGQRLYDPPSPAGWDGGAAWVNASTMLTRSNFIAQITAMAGPAAADIPGLLRRNGATGSAAAVVDWLLDLLVGGDVAPGSRQVLIDHIGGEAHFNFDRAARDGSLHGLCYLAMTMPLYQVA